MVRFNYDEEISPNLNDVDFRFINSEDRFSSDFIGDSEVEPPTDSVIKDYDHDETQYVLNLLEKHGSLVQQDYQPKIFCRAKPGDINSIFEVKSNRFNWDVMPVNNENIVQIPKKYIKKSGVLAANNVSTKGFAIAKPKPKEDPCDVMKQELIHELTVFSKISVFFLSLIASAMKSTVNNFAVTPGSVESTKLLELPDPVLLVMIDDNWIEIGRWE